MVAKKDRIVIEHLGTEYTIDILDCKPNNVVDIVETMWKWILIMGIRTCDEMSSF